MEITVMVQIFAGIVLVTECSAVALNDTLIKGAELNDLKANVTEIKGNNIFILLLQGKITHFISFVLCTREVMSFAMFITSKSFDFEVCWSVGLFVCLCVCMYVCWHVLGHNFEAKILIFFL